MVDPPKNTKPRRGSIATCPPQAKTELHRGSSPPGSPWQVHHLHCRPRFAQPKGLKALVGVGDVGVILV